MEPQEKQVLATDTKITQEKLTEFYQSYGWKPDAYGNLKKSLNQDGKLGEGRIKLNSTAWRKEVKVGGGWMRLKSAYYKYTYIKTYLIDGKEVKKAGATKYN